MSQDFAPGLNNEERNGLYFSLLPNELIKLLDYFYYFPIKIDVLSVAGYDGSIYYIDAIFYRYYVHRNAINNDLFNMGFHMPKFLNFLLDSINEIYPEDRKHSHIHVKKELNQINITLNTMSETIQIVYDNYEKNVLIKKLQKIHSDIEKYKRIGLSHVELNVKIQEYPY